jgi:hypothetical protein
MTKAQCELKAAGLAYPRTCPVCLLGVCVKFRTVPVDALAFIDQMLDFRARKIAKAVDAGDDAIVQEWSRMQVTEFFRRYREATEVKL